MYPDPSEWVHVQEADELLAARPGDLPGVTNERESRRRREKRQPEMPVGVVQVIRLRSAVP